MISHDGVTKQIPAVPDDGLLEPIDQPESVRVIANDLLAGIPRRHHVINGAFGTRVAVFVAFREVKGQETGCQAKNQKPRLTPRTIRVSTFRAR